MYNICVSLLSLFCLSPLNPLYLNLPSHLTYIYYIYLSTHLSYFSFSSPFLLSSFSLPPFSLQDQYVFIHDALDELITCGETDIQINNLKKKIELLNKFETPNTTGFQAQFQVMHAHEFHTSILILS